ncbi:MAG: DNA polymerase III subunit alpha [Oscillospiraceae bacterium]
MAFVHLHLHSEYSLLDGACRINELVTHVKSLGQTAVAVTDHGNLYAAVQFWLACKKAGIKAVIGCEVYVAQRTRFDRDSRFDANSYHLVLLCENETGYRNLCKLVSAAYTEGFYSRPRVDFELLRKHSEGLICLSACMAGEVARRLSEGNFEAAKECALRYQGLFGRGNYFIEIQNQKFKEQERLLPLQFKLSRETGIALVATNDAHYLRQNDAAAQQILMCISTKTTVDEPQAMRFPSDEFFVKSEAEMLALFPGHEDAVRRTQELADRCEVNFTFGETKLPYFRAAGEESNFAYLRRLCEEGLAARYTTPTDEARARLDYELRVIGDMGYTDYFLIVRDFVQYAKDHDIPVGVGRGSGAGSLCAYCIGITGIDPLRYNLIFERFLNPERVSMPDFDIDFCIEGRQRVIDYVVEKYGADHVAQIVTFGTLAAKAAVRDVARAMGLSYQVGDAVAKLVPRELNISLRRAIDETPELKELYGADLKIRSLLDTAMQIEGMPRNAGTHAAGVVITKEPVTEYVPVQSRDGVVSTQYTMTVLESLGLLKIDFLGLRNLTVIRTCENEIRKTVPDFSIERITMDDAAVYKMLSDGLTKGVFQFESAGMTETIMRLQPTCIEDLVAVISLYRPGPMDAIPTYIRNRHNPKLVRYKHPLLKSILEVTYGCIVYQEQVMQIFRELAGYSYGRADIVRRAMSKKKHDVLQNERRAFIFGENNPGGSVGCAGALANGVPEKIAGEIFDEMASFASYAFNKSHAAAYATISYQTAFLKCHYYTAYMAALMSSVVGEGTGGKLIEYCAECRKNGVVLLPVDVNRSGEAFTAEGGAIRFPLAAVKGLGGGAARAIIDERIENGFFTDIRDFCLRMARRDLNIRAVEALICAGALDGFPENRRTMLRNHDRLLKAANDEIRTTLKGQMSLFDMMEEPEDAGLALQYVEEFTRLELLEMEREAVGVYITGHPLEGFSALGTAAGAETCAGIAAKADESAKLLKDGDKVELLAMLRGKKLFTTRNGGRMCFCELEDMTGVMEGVVFAAVFETYSNLLQENGILYLSGRLSLKEDEAPKLLVQVVRKAEDFEAECARKVLCLRLHSTDAAALGAVKAAALRFSGESQLRIYFSDLKKMTALKGGGIAVTNASVDALLKIVGEGNGVFSG